MRVNTTVVVAALEKKKQNSPLKSVIIELFYDLKSGDFLRLFYKFRQSVYPRK